MGRKMGGKRVAACAGLAAALFIGIGVTFAQMDTGRMPSVDGAFLREASLSSAWKVDLGEIALRQAASRDVREFSQLMIQDQGRIGLELKALAERKGVNLSGDLGPVRRNTGISLSREYGAAFDRNFISLMMDEHQRDAALYGAEIERGLDGDVKAFAGRMIEKLESYVGRAKKILLALPQPLLK